MSGLDNTRQVMLTICRSFVPVSEAMFLLRNAKEAKVGELGSEGNSEQSEGRTWA